MSPFTGPLPNAWERNAAKTSCPRGHLYQPPNLYVNPAGWRECRACHRLRQRQYAARKAREVVTTSTARIAPDLAQKGGHAGDGALESEVIGSSSPGGNYDAVGVLGRPADPAESR